MNIQEKYIKRCIEIAKSGIGTTAPNPMVGCVIVNDHNIIGEGYTSPFGGNHAEVNAINKVKDKSLLKSATLYVTLEPCSHYGKTPPCSNLIIKHKVPNVVIGCVDPNPKVAGKGIAKLKAAGCKVTEGILEAECLTHHKRFFTYHNKKRPYVILKWAETLDGFIAPASKDKKAPVWITQPHSRQLVHKWRAEEQAILVGTNTVLQDNPSLTVRDWAGKNPIRIVLDQHLKTSANFKVFNKEAKTILITSEKNQDESHQGFTETINLTSKFKIAQQICDVLHNNGINSVIIEGGSKTLQTFIDEKLWDKALIFKGPLTFKHGILAPKIQGRFISEINLLNDNLTIYRND